MFENISRAILPLAVLFVPVLAGVFSGELYKWYEFVHRDPATLHGEEAHLHHVKHLYFATPFLLARLALYFGVWAWYSAADLPAALLLSLYRTILACCSLRWAVRAGW